MKIFYSSLVAYRHVVLGFVLICFAVSFFPLMAYCHLIRRICFNLLRRLLFFTHGISPRNSAHLFFLLREFILTHALHRRTVCCSCILNASCFRKSLVVYAHRARPRLPSCKRLRSKECPMCRMKKAFRPRRTTKDRKANNLQCAKQNGDMPQPGNNRPRSE